MRFSINFEGINSDRVPRNINNTENYYYCHATITSNETAFHLNGCLDIKAFTRRTKQTLSTHAQAEYIVHEIII